MPLAKVEQLLATGACLQARREAERLLSDGTISTQERGRLHQLAGRAAFMLRDLFGSVRHGERALGYARECGDHALLAPVHLDLGSAYTHIGDGHLAAEHLRAFLAAAPPDPGWRQHRGTACRHLAQVARQGRQWTQSIEWLRRARELLEPAHLAQLELDLAWCHLMLHLPDLAASHLAAAEAHLAENPDAHAACLLLYHRAYCHRLKGELAASTALCQELFTPGRRGTSDLPLAYAAWIMGENALDLGLPAEAQLFANLALDYSVKGNLPPVMNLSGNLRRRIAAATATT